MFFLKFLMCMTCSVLSFKLAASFSTFSIFILSEKIVNHDEVHVIFQVIDHHLRENILHHFLHYSFL